MEEDNHINFGFLERDQKPFVYSVLIILSADIDSKQIKFYIKQSDYVICVNDAANKIYDIFSSVDISQGDIKKQVDCIFCDTSSVKEEVLKYFENKNAKILLKNEEASPDLNKCLYFSLEKISENVCNNYIDMASGKSCSIYLLGVGDRFDYTVSLLQTVNQYVTTFFSLKTEFYIISKTSIAVFLKKGVNYIKPYHDNQQQSQGYSIISICDKAELNLTEYLGESLKDTITKTMGLCSVFFRNNHNIDLVKILVKGMNSGFVLFSYYYNQIDV